MSQTTKKHYYKKIREVKTRIIHFVNRTWTEIQEWYDRLKSRYKRLVKLGKITTVHGMLSGSFSVA